MSTLEFARPLVDALRARGLRCATAESCTGGGVAAAITDIAGSSEVFESGFVTYSNAAKVVLLGVDAAMLAVHGAVSEEVARAMAEGARARAGVDLAVSITGIAGPGGATPGKPVGTVWFGLAAAGAPTQAEVRHFHGDRAAVRRQSVHHALGLLAEGVARLSQSGDRPQVTE